MRDRIQRVREAVEVDYRGFFERICGVEFQGNRDVGYCGFHPDADQSFSTTFLNGRRHWKCFAGCGSGDIFDAYQKAANLPEFKEGFREALEALEEIYGLVPEGWKRGSGPSDLPGVVREQPKRVSKGGGKGRGGLPESAKLAYSDAYTDENGTVLYEVCRFEWIEGKRPKKTFRQRRPDPALPGGWSGNLQGVRRVPFGLPALLKASFVVLVEGEKDRRTLQKLQIFSTCIAGGALSWKPDYAEYFAGKLVIVAGDNDEVGLKFIADACRDIAPVAKSVKTWLPPMKYKEKSGPDITDWTDKTKATRSDVLRSFKELGADFHPEPVPEPDEEEGPPAEEDRSPEAVPLHPHPGSKDDPLAWVGPTVSQEGPVADRIAALQAGLRQTILKGAPGPTKKLFLWAPEMMEQRSRDDVTHIVRGPDVGIMTADNLLYGLRAAWYVVEGFSGLGKSTLMNQFVQHTAEAGIVNEEGHEERFRWLVICLEDDPQTWRVMTLSRLSAVDGKHLATGDYATKEMKLAVDAQLSRLWRIESNLAFPDPDLGSPTLTQIGDMIEQFQEEVGYGNGAVLIDPLHQVEPPSEMTEYQFMEMACRKIRDLQRRFRIPLITNVHMSTEGRAKGTRRFEYGADIRLRLEIGEEAEKRNREELSVEQAMLHPYQDLVVVKNKGARTGRILLRYRKDIATFIEIGRSWE